jgi:uncharacterized membrane protein YfcA
MVPLLVLGFGFAQKSAQGTALFVMLPMALVGAIRYKLHPDIEINLTVAGLMALGGVVGALLGSQLAFVLPTVVLKRMFAVFIIISGIHILNKTRQQPAVEAQPAVPELPTEPGDLP